MIRIRLQRKGRKRRPIYHIVVADSRSPRDGRIIEQVGRYDGVTEKKELVLNEERIMHWLDTGAQPSDTVRKILRNSGLLYKRHLKMWGKSDAEIEAALEEWNNYREAKSKEDESRKDKHKDVLAAEEKEYKKQVEEKAAAAAKAQAKTEPEAEVTADETADAETESAAPETPATEEAAVETTEPAAEEAPAEEAETAAAETTEEPAAEAEAVKEEEPAEETPAEPAAAPEEAETPEPAQEAPAAEEKTKPEAAAESESTGQKSTDMTAKEAIDFIRGEELAALEGFVQEDETRKTVLAAWESKQAED